ncbi:MAG TPA: GntR family transcriptional regulator [Devosiaceae bacterium]|jgi:DNA-binding GntR family transcriptional regulator|nr:GntR family transcriptional regulator [Devosiaceae bacterium]
MAGTNSGTLIKRPSRLGDEVYNAIYAQLMSLKIPPGGRLSVDSLVRELGVSQTPIREALSRLEAQGLVVKTHLVGYSAAAQMDASRFEQLYQLRSLLEPFAAGQAAVNMSEEALAALTGHAAAMSPDGGDPDIAYSRFAQWDSEFHNMVASGSGNELIQETLARLHIHVHLFRLVYHARAAAAAIEEHAEIIDAISRRDPTGAEAAMTAHIQRSKERFARAVQP